MVDRESSDDFETPRQRCEECVRCDELRDTASAGKPNLEMMELTSTDEVLAYPDVSETEDLHIADQDKIQAVYDVEPYIDCSYTRRRHQHGKGLIVDMFCGKRLRMGRVCGKKSVLGFDGVLSTATTVKNFHRDRARLKDWAADAISRLGSLEPQVSALVHNHDQIKANLPRMYSELSRRSSAKPMDTAVSVEKSQGALIADEHSGKVLADIRHIAGLKILRPTGAISKLSGIVREFKVKGEQDPPIDIPSTKALMEYVKHFERLFDSTTEWVREASNFAHVGNLELVLYAMHADNPRVHEEDGRLRVSYMPNERALLKFVSVA